MKCADCTKNIDETFLKKPIGTSVLRAGKRVMICNECQRKTQAK